MVDGEVVKVVLVGRLELVGVLDVILAYASVGRTLEEAKVVNNW